jgi:hypothetical protein
MEIKSSSGNSTYWLPDCCAIAGLYERLTLYEHELEAGDMVPYGTTYDLVLNTWYNGKTHWIRYQEVGPSGATATWAEEVFPHVRFEDVFRPTPAGPGGARMKYEPEQEIVLKKPERRWNGTCPLCGKGTYTGAWDVEHDGTCR